MFQHIPFPSLFSKHIHILIALKKLVRIIFAMYWGFQTWWAGLMFCNKLLESYVSFSKLALTISCHSFLEQVLSFGCTYSKNCCCDWVSIQQAYKKLSCPLICHLYQSASIAECLSLLAEFGIFFPKIFINCFQSSINFNDNTLSSWVHVEMLFCITKLQFELACFIIAFALAPSFAKWFCCFVSLAMYSY